MYDGEIRAGEEVLDWIVGESSGDHTIGKLNLIIFGGGGQIEPCDTNISENCLCSHHNNNALLTLIISEGGRGRNRAMRPKKRVKIACVFTIKILH